MVEIKKIKITVTALLLFIICGFVFSGIHRLLKTDEIYPVYWNITEKIYGKAGYWKADCYLNKIDFSKNDDVKLNIRLRIISKEFEKHMGNCKGVSVVVIAERVFDKDGHPNLMNNNFMSGVLTPTGMPIEFYTDPSESFAKDNRPYQSILELRDFRQIGQLKPLKDGALAEFVLNGKIPPDLPDGYYRFHLDFYAFLNNGRRRLSLVSTLWITERSKGIINNKLASFIQKVYTSPVFVTGNPAVPRMIWSFFLNNISMGTKGVIAEEDKDYFRLNPRHNISDKYIIQPGTTLNIEPDFPVFFADKSEISFIEKNWPFCVPIPLDYKSGEFSVKIILPDGSQQYLGKSRFTRQSITGASSGTNRYRFKFSKFGQYTIKMDGWIKDLWGHKYRGGGTYYLWVANRLSFATSVKPGSPFEVGDSYPTSVFVHPPFAARVTIDITEYINSRKDKEKKWHAEGVASRFGYFYSKDKITFEEPGEYIVKINAEYKDKSGKLWIGNEAGSCVIAPVDTKLIVHGRKFARVMNVREARFNSNFEGYDKRDGKSVWNSFLDYAACVSLFIPYYSGDMMFIASVPDGSNGIDGMLTAQFEEGVDVKTETENNIHPYVFPEKIKKHAYFYFSGIRPGIIARTLVADPGAVFKDSYWATNPAFNAFGRQFNASEDDDLPQDIYRLMGGFVFNDKENNRIDYGIYSSMAIVIPKGSRANRVVAPFSEPLLKVNGRQFYIFEAGAPSQGVIYEVNEPISIGGMVFPTTGGINCIKKIIFPDGRKVISQGITNKIGILNMSPSKVIVDIPGVYKIKESCWQGDYRGDIIGTADGTYNIYVDDKDTKKYFRFLNPRHFIFNPDEELELTGIVTDDLKDVKLTYSVIMPGCVMDEGTLAVKRGSFSYKFRPEEFNAQFPNYNFSRTIETDVLPFSWKAVIKKYFGPKPKRIADLVMMTFFLQGKDKSSNKKVYDVATVMLRGEKVYICEYE